MNFLTVLTAGSQLAGEAPALLSQIGRKRSIAVEAFVRVADAFLLGAGVVHRKHVDIEWCELQLAARKARTLDDLDRRDRGADVAEECDGSVVDVRNHRVGVLVEALAKARCGRHLGDAEGGLEERVLAPVLDGIEIALAGADDADIADDAVGMRDAVAQRDVVVEVGAEPREAERAADEGEARMRGGRVGVRLHDLEAPHALHLPSEPPSASTLDDSRIVTERYRTTPEPKALKQVSVKPERSARCTTGASIPTCRVGCKGYGSRVAAPEQTRIGNLCSTA